MNNMPSHKGMADNKDILKTMVDSLYIFSPSALHDFIRSKVIFLIFTTFFLSLFFFFVNYTAFSNSRNLGSMKDGLA